jgi:hypothetical protein
VNARAVQRIERLGDAGHETRLQNLDTDAKSLGRGLDRLQLQRARGRVPQNSDAGQR